VNRRDNSPGRRMHGHAAEAAYLDGEGYPDETYLDADAYPVDPGYRGYSGGRLRPGDVPVGPPRTRPERTVSPRAGFPPRPSRQAPRDQGAFDRPWQRPEDPPPGAGRPRPRPAGSRPRPQGGNRARPTVTEDPFIPNGPSVPPGRRAAPPRGPRSDGFYGPPADGTYSGGRPPGWPWGRPGREGPGYGPGARGQGQAHRAGGARYGRGQPGQEQRPGQYGPDQYGAGHYGANHYGAGPSGAEPFGPGRSGPGPSRPGAFEPGAFGPGQYGPGRPAPGQYGAGQFGPDAGDRHGPGGQSYPGGDPYTGGGRYRYGPEAARYGPGAGQAGPHGPGQPGPGYGQAPPGRAGQGAYGPGPSGPGHPGGGPGPYGSGPPEAGQYGAGQQPPSHRQRRPGTGAGRLGDPPRGGARPGVGDTGAWAQASGTVIRQRDSALPDPSPNAKGAIAAIEADNVAGFARDLRVLRSNAGLDYPDMAEKSHYTMRTLASAAGGLRLPTLPVLIAYVKACGGDATEWEERWGKLVRSGKKGQAALPAAGTDTSNDEPGVTADGLPGTRPGSGGPSAPGAPEAGPVPPGPPGSGEVYVITSAKPRDDRW